MSDAMRYHGGMAAEDAVARHYEAAGGAVLATRFRTQAGEIDLIVQQADEVIFVEVKARKTHAAARLSLSERQQRRILQAAELWLAETGRSPLTPCRFDLAAVDAQGRIDILHNSLQF